MLVFQAVPKLRDQRKALGRGQTHELVMGEQFHAFETTKKAGDEQAVQESRVGSNYFGAGCDGVCP